MAIKYAGDRNLIGYGEAQVYKDVDLTKGVELEKGRQERARNKKASAAAKKKEANDKALAELLKEQDLSKVRNADIDYLTTEFNDIIGEAGNIVSQGGNPATNIELQKRLNQYRANTNQSATGRDAHDKMLKQAVESEDYQGDDNINNLGASNAAPMFGEEGTYFDGKDVGVEGDADFVPGAKGAQLTSLKPTLHIQAWEKEVADNIKPQAISMSPGDPPSYTLPASGGNFLTFETKEEATDAQLEMAANDLYNNHKYGDHMKSKYDQLALENNFFTIDPDTQEEVPDAMAYLKNKVAGMTTKLGTKTAIDKPAAKSNTYVSITNKEKEDTAIGEDFGATSYNYPGKRSTGPGEGDYDNVELNYPNVNIPAVYKDVNGEKVLVTPERIGQTFDFGTKAFDVSPEANSGFMVFGQSDDGTMEPGFSRSGQNISFVPKAITFKPTAKKEIKVKINGKMQTFAAGEALDSEAIKLLQDAKRGGEFSSKPWLEGKAKSGGMTLSIAFSDNVHRRFSTHVSFANKRNRGVYEGIMRKIGTEPIKQ